MRKITAAGMAAAALMLSGCATVEDGARAAAQVVNPWQDDLRDSLMAEFDADPEGVADGCLGFSMFGIDTPEQVGALVFAFAEEEDIPAPSTTIGQWADEQGTEVPFSVPRDLTVREVMNEAGAVMLDYCGIDY